MKKAYYNITKCVNRNIRFLATANVNPIGSNVEFQILITLFPMFTKTLNDGQFCFEHVQVYLNLQIELQKIECYKTDNYIHAVTR